VKDRLRGHYVRRLNVLVYANYGDPSAHIIHASDHDYPDIRSADHDTLIAHEVQEQASSARALIEERERRKMERIKRQIREYHVTRSEAVKKEWEETNALYPFLFSLAWRELKAEKAAAVAPAAAAAEGPSADVLYPLDTELREQVLEIERIIRGIGEDVARLRAEGRLDERLAEACGKSVGQARAALSGRDKAELNPRRLRMLRASLLTKWRGIHAQSDG